MTLEELQDLVDKKTKINDTELDLEALKTPQLHNEFMKLYNKFKLMLTKSQAELSTIKLSFDFEIVNGSISCFNANKKVDSLILFAKRKPEPPIRRLRIITVFLKKLLFILILFN